MKKRARYQKPPRWPSVLMVSLVAILVLGFGSVLFIRRSYHQNLRPVSASQKTQLFTVEKGATVKEIAASLQQAQLIRSTWAFEWYVRNRGLGNEIQAGTYSLRPNLTVQEIVEVLTQGEIATDLVTILPGQRLDQVRHALIAKYGFSETAVDAALNPINYTDHPALVDKPVGASLEGYLYPDSFQKTAQTDPATIIRASLDQMQKHLTPDLRAGIVRQGLTVHQGIILASVVGQEVSDPEDKRTVAQVFLRRLREDRPLQSDATALYGSILAGATPSRSYESAYNTYSHRGLPPSPITNVNQSSLEAVANPSPTNFLYFVAGDDGKTYFSNTLKEHENLVRQHCKTLCAPH
jgi:UPF0755 protein